MKRFFLVLLFVLSQFLLPFVFAKCGGEDKPYIKTTDAKPDCTDDEFLTADCVAPTAKKLEADNPTSDENTEGDGDDEESEDQ